MLPFFVLFFNYNGFLCHGFGFINLFFGFIRVIFNLVRVRLNRLAARALYDLRPGVCRLCDKRLILLLFLLG